MRAVRIEDGILLHAELEAQLTLYWRTVTVGPGLVDVDFFVGGALTAEDRREHEERLVQGYPDELCRYSIDYS